MRSSDPDDPHDTAGIGSSVPSRPRTRTSSMETKEKHRGHLLMHHDDTDEEEEEQPDGRGTRSKQKELDLDEFEM